MPVEWEGQQSIQCLIIEDGPDGPKKFSKIRYALQVEQRSAVSLSRFAFMYDGKCDGLVVRDRILWLSTGRVDLMESPLR